MRIWCDAHVPDVQWKALRETLKHHELVREIDQHPRTVDLARCEVAFGKPPVQAVIETPSVRWVQVTAAGYAQYDQSAFRQAMSQRGGAVTNSSSVYAEPCAQHLHAMILAFARGLPVCWANQMERSWQRPKNVARLLNGQKVLLVGMGAIARRLIELLAPYEMQFAGVRRTIRGNEPIPVITAAEIDPWLEWADHVVNILPGGDETRAFFNAHRIGLIRKDAFFYNIGRGTTVDQPALEDALRGGHLAGAYLDVTDPEPLPADHPLWETPNCYITPHIAGTHQNGWDRLIAHFVENLKRWESGMPLSDRVM